MSVGSCYSKGIRAFRDGLPIEACPYQPEWKPAEDWREGWRDAEAAGDRPAPRSAVPLETIVRAFEFEARRTTRAVERGTKTIEALLAKAAQIDRIRPSAAARRDAERAVTADRQSAKDNARLSLVGAARD